MGIFASAARSPLAPLSRHISSRSRRPTEFLEVRGLGFLDAGSLAENIDDLFRMMGAPPFRARRRATISHFATALTYAKSWSFLDAGPAWSRFTTVATQ